MQKCNNIDQDYRGSMIIQVDGGLYNRLRASLSYLSHCRRKKQQLIVVWRKNTRCNFSFNKLFEPIQGMLVTNNNMGQHPIGVGGQIYPPEMMRYMGLYKELRPVEAMQKKIADEVRKLGENFIAIHVRRTDHVDLAKQQESFTPDSEFFRFIEEHDDDCCKVYLATDNKETQDLFLNKFPGRIHFYKPIEKSEDLRQTSLKQAVVDLFVCKYANAFKGSGWSSFSDTIMMLRE